MWNFTFPKLFYPDEMIKGWEQNQGRLQRAAQWADTTATGESVQPPIKISLPGCICELSNNGFINCLLKLVCESWIYCDPTVGGQSCSSSGLTSSSDLEI